MSTLGVKRLTRLALVVVVASITLSTSSQALPHHHLTVLSLRVDGHRLVNGSGDAIRLIGVGGFGTEYACVQGWGYTSTPLSEATVHVLSEWHVNAVRLTLNEDCWLGINHEPSYGTVNGYRTAIESFVRELNSANIYVILDLHWSAPGTQVATDQMAMPDLHSLRFWLSVATRFKTDPAVLFDVFNEPFSPREIWPGAPKVSWKCWRNGGCPVPAINQSQHFTSSTPTFRAVGMQQLITAIRATGARQPVMLGGLDYSNDLGGFLVNQPTDPLRTPQLIASFHNYSTQACQATCWNNTIAPIANHVPVVTGEFGEGNFCLTPPALPATQGVFDSSFMQWADAHAVSYLAWGWVVNGTPPPCASGESQNANFGLISTLGGSPVAPDGLLLKDHLASLHSRNPLL